jgi:hypothetical protein
MEKEKLIVTFDPKNHTYKVNGLNAVSVTTILREVGIAEDFSEVSDYVKKRIEEASLRGIYYDQLAEDAVLRPFELNDWQTKLLEKLKEGGFNPTGAQTRLGTLFPFPIAGTPDFDEEEAIVDLKATYLIKINYVTWQTNLYSWMKNRERHEHFRRAVIHYNEKDDRFTLIPLKYIPEEKIIKMLECYQLGEKYIEETSNELSKVINLAVFSDTFNDVKIYEQLLKEEQEKLTDFYAKIKKYMIDNAIEKIDLENFTISYSKAFTRTTINYGKAAEDVNKKKLEAVNKFLVENKQEPYILITSEDMKTNLPEKDIPLYSTISNISDKIIVTEKKQDGESKKKKGKS